MARTKPSPVGASRGSSSWWIAIGVTLRRQGEQALDHPPERALVASPRHTFADLALAIDDAFGRWELGRHREFTLADGTRVGDVETGRWRGAVIDYRRARLHHLDGGASFSYAVDDGERWGHQCLLLGAIDPDEVLAGRPGHPVAYQSVGRAPVLSTKSS